MIWLASSGLSTRSTATAHPQQWEVANRDYVEKVEAAGGWSAIASEEELQELLR